MNKHILVSLFAVLLSNLGFSQLSYENRTEIQLKDGYTNERIIIFGEKEILLRSRSENKNSGNFEWKYDLYNSDLKKTNSLSLNLPKSFYSDELFVSSDRMHTFFNTKKGFYKLVTIESKTLNKTIVEGQLPKKTWAREMAVLGDYAYFRARVKKNNYLFNINWKTGERNFIPIHIQGFKGKRTHLVDFQILNEPKEILLIIHAYKNREKEIFITRLNDKGEKIDIFKLTGDLDKNIVYATGSYIEKDRYVFTGTFSDHLSTFSKGIYFCEVYKGKITTIKYYNFLDLENFLNYLPEKKQKKIEKKKKRKEAKGKEMNVNYRIASHPIRKVEGGYLFIGESYYPTYRYETYQVYINGKYVTRHRRVFDGYQYTHAVLAKFDHQGNKLWDQTFEMWPSYKPYFVKRFISVAREKQDEIKLVFSSYNRIISKSFDFNGNILQEKESESIKTGYEGDKTKWSFSNISYWYDNYFIAYGRQKIKNKKGEAEKKKRTVYFLSKIKY